MLLAAVLKIHRTRSSSLTSRFSTWPCLLAVSPENKFTTTKKYVLSPKVNIGGKDFFESENLKLTSRLSILNKTKYPKFLLKSLVYFTI